MSKSELLRLKMKIEALSEADHKTLLPAIVHIIAPGIEAKKIGNVTRIDLEDMSAKQIKILKKYLADHYSSD